MDRQWSEEVADPRADTRSHLTSPGRMSAVGGCDSSPNTLQPQVLVLLRQGQTADASQARGPRRPPALQGCAVYMEGTSSGRSLPPDLGPRSLEETQSPEPSVCIIPAPAVSCS